MKNISHVTFRSGRRRARLAKEPARRPASMDDLSAALDALDLAPWTEAEARAWWRERAQTVRAAGSRRDTPASPPPTVAIDLGRREAAGLESTQIVQAEAR